MEEKPTTQHSEKPCSPKSVVKKPCSSSSQEQITLNILQYALFGCKPVKMVKTRCTSYSSGEVIGNDNK